MTLKLVSGDSPEPGYKPPTIPTPWGRLEAEANFQRALERLQIAEEEERYKHRIEFRNRAIYELGWSMFALLMFTALCFLGEAHGWHF